MIFSFREEVLVSAQVGTPHLDARMFDSSRSPLQMALAGIGTELALTFLVTFVIYATFIDPRAVSRPASQRWACLWLGLAVLSATLVAYPLTGAAMNPARWLGTVVWEARLAPLRAQDPFRDHYVYWFGPISGALLAGIIYQLFILPTEKPPEKDLATLIGRPLRSRKDEGRIM